MQTPAVAGPMDVHALVARHTCHGELLDVRADVDGAAGARECSDVGSVTLGESDPPAVGRRHNLGCVSGLKMDDLVAAASVDACQDELLVARLGEVDAVAGAIEPRVIGIVAHLSRLVRRPGDRDDEQPGALCIRETPDAVGTRASKDEPPAVRRERGPRVMTGRAHDVPRLGTVRAHDPNAALLGVRPGGVGNPGAVRGKSG